MTASTLRLIALLGILVVFGAVDQCREIENEIDAHVITKIIPGIFKGI
jgi:hypothetical protein